MLDTTTETATRRLDPIQSLKAVARSVMHRFSVARNVLCCDQATFEKAFQGRVDNPRRGSGSTNEKHRLTDTESHALAQKIEQLTATLTELKRRSEQGEEYRERINQDGTEFASRIIRSLQSARVVTEEATLSIGSMIALLFDTAKIDNELAISMLEKVIGNAESDIKADALADVLDIQKQSITEFIGETQSFFDRQYSLATQAREACSEMLSCAAKVDRLVFSSELLAFNVRVEAIRLGDNGSTFAVLAEEMVRFSHAINQANRAIQRSIETVSKRMSVYHDESAQMKSQVSDFADQLNKQMDFVQSHTDQLSQSLASTLKRITQSNSVLMSASQDALSALQFHDPLHQDLCRTEHEVRKLITLVETGTCDDTRLQEIDPTIGNDGTLEREAGVVELF